MAVTRDITARLKLPTSNAVTNGGLDLESVNDTTAHPTTVYLDTSGYHEGFGIFWIHTNDGTTDAVTCAINQATSAAGGSAKAVAGAGYAAGSLPAGSADYVIFVPFSTDMLDRTNAFRYVGATFVAAGNTDTMVISSAIIRGRPRHADDTLSVA